MFKIVIKYNKIKHRAVVDVEIVSAACRRGLRCCCCRSVLIACTSSIARVYVPLERAGTARFCFCCSVLMACTLSVPPTNFGL